MNGDILKIQDKNISLREINNKLRRYTRILSMFCLLHSQRYKTDSFCSIEASVNHLAAYATHNKRDWSSAFSGIHFASCSLFSQTVLKKPGTQLCVTRFPHKFAFGFDIFILISVATVRSSIN